MDIRIIAAIILAIDIAGLIACCYVSGKEFEKKNYSVAMGLLGCAAVFFATMLGILL